MALGLHCDFGDCEQFVFADDEDAAEWVQVYTEGEHYHFCNGWHMTRWGSLNYDPADVDESDNPDG